ncbi:MAG: AAA family ATPase, partial [Prevotellaceae bacterium]|nr:AAA family ATPase [Prevotellaceae bacterium]
MDNSLLLAIARDYVEQTSQHVFLTGKAGTGKTTFLRHIVAATHKHAVVAAPTGVAAINAGGVTLHSLFQLSFAPYIPNSQCDYSHFSQSKLDVLRRMELLIIDEVSMLRADTLDAIDAVLRRVRRSSKVFGGVQMLYIGDMFQLPPVVKDDEWAVLKNYYSSQFFFHAHALQKNPPVYIELKQVYRQQDSSFVDLLNRVRNNTMQQSDFELLNSRFVQNFIPPNDKKFITLTTHNYQADKINSEKLNQIQSQLFEFHGNIKNDFPEYMLPVEMTLQLKQEAQIMFVKNDSSQEKLYYNGKIGTITYISEDRICVLCEGEDTEIQLHAETWENNRYTLNKESGGMEEEVLGTFTQYPVRLAWAITVHKSQGLTFSNVILDISRAFAAG